MATQATRVRQHRGPISRRARLALLACLGLSATACSRGCGSSASPSGASTNPTGVAGSSTATGAGKLGEAAPTASRKAHPLVVAGAEGILEVDRSGKVLRTLSKTPAAEARWLGDEELIFLVVRAAPVAGSASNQPVEIRRLSFKTGKEQRVAPVPPFSCSGTEDDAAKGANAAPMGVHSGSDFVVDERLAAACLTLMDRNANLAGTVLELKFSLATGQVERRLLVADESCKPAGIERNREGFGCAALEPMLVHDDSRFPYHLDEERLLRTGPDGKDSVVTQLGGFDQDHISPSGRWQLLDGNREEGDYIHFLVVLLDRIEGNIYPVRDQPGPWGPGLTVSELVDGTRLARLTAGVVGETEVHWIDLGDTEAVIVDDVLMIPGRPAVRLPGRPAR